MEENDELDPDCNFAVDELDADDTTSSSGTRSESGSGTEQEQGSSPDRSPDAVNATTREDDGLQEFADEELLSASSDTDTADSSSSETDSSDEASDGLAPALPVPCEVLPALTNDRLARLPGANTELSATQAPAACVHQQLERGNAVQLHAPEAHKHAAQATNTTGAAGVASHTNHIPDACSNQAAAAAAPAPSQPPGESFMQQLLGPDGMQQHAFPTYTSAGTTTQGEQQRPPPLLALPAPASVYNTRARCDLRDVAIEELEQALLEDWVEEGSAGAPPLWAAQGHELSEYERFLRVLRGEEPEVALEEDEQQDEADLRMAA